MIAVKISEVAPKTTLTVRKLSYFRVSCHHRSFRGLGNVFVLACAHLCVITKKTRSEDNKKRASAFWNDSILRQGGRHLILEAYTSTCTKPVPYEMWFRDWSGSMELQRRPRSVEGARCGLIEICLMLLKYHSSREGILWHDLNGITVHQMGISNPKTFRWSIVCIAQTISR